MKYQLSLMSKREREKQEDKIRTMKVILLMLFVTNLLLMAALYIISR